jgi:hypothetical protein
LLEQIAPASSAFSVKSKNFSAAAAAMTSIDLIMEEGEEGASKQHDAATAISASIQFRSALPSIIKDDHASKHVKQSFRSMNDLILLGDTNDSGISYQKCYQLLWPTKSEAFKYLASKRFYFLFNNNLFAGLPLSS